MAALIQISPFVERLGGGGTVTYKGSPSRCIWWALVGVNVGVEGAAYGTLTNQQVVTDDNGYATAVYTAPTSIGASQNDRIKVFESIAVA